MHPALRLPFISEPSFMRMRNAVSRSCEQLHSLMKMVFDLSRRFRFEISIAGRRIQLVAIPFRVPFLLGAATTRPRRELSATADADRGRRTRSNTADELD